MTLFRKRIPVDLLVDLNDYIAGRRNPYAEDADEMIRPTAPRRMPQAGNRTKAQVHKRQVKRNSLPTGEH